MLAKKLESAAKAVESAYIEDVFSTYLYTGNGSTQTITNGIDLSTKGGLVWLKSRSVTGNNWTQDTVRGVNSVLYPNLTNAAGNPAGTAVSAFNTTGFSLGSNTNINNSGDTYVSWTFREQPKFFDIVTYTGDGTTNQTIPHNLGSTPGCIITKRTDSTGNWTTWHTSFADTKTYIYLNTTDASVNVPGATAMTVSSTSFTVGSNQIFGNGSGFTYVAYLFAHNAGGFGLTGSDNVISCGSFTTDGSGNATVTLGYEPQWVLLKDSTSVANWGIVDVMRSGLVNQSATSSKALFPNLTNSESNLAVLGATSTGFSSLGAGTLDVSSTYIYIAIRRGPMKVPTTGTSVFSPNVSSATTGTKVTTGFPIDAQIVDYRATPAGVFLDRLRGVSSTSTASGQYLKTTTTDAETTVATASLGWDNTGFQINAGWSGADTVYYNFQRAPSFFDEVCYTGTGSATTQTHNLGVAPELMIVKSRSGTGNWKVWNKSSLYTNLWLNSDVATQSDSVNSPTATTFAIFNDSNTASVTYVAYLFATCPGVSKVGSYTGNGSSQTINCGFTGGARFVLIKRTDNTGDWYVWDTARGIVSGNDPHLSLNTTAAEVTTDDTIDPDSTGFIVNQLAATNVNVSSATYIYLAIA